VALGELREDLYYWLKIITIELPPLRDPARDLARPRTRAT
jgi:transcriptional regulator with PAS, ATPase and Fis domain